MSQPNQYPSQPGWGQQPPAGWGTPPPQPPKKSPTGKIVGFACLGAVAAFVISGAIGAAVSGGDDKPNTKATAAPSNTPDEQPTPTEITAECRAWIEDELLDSTEAIDATAGYSVCGDLTGDEMDRAIEEVTSDLASQDATPAAGPEEYADGDYEIGTDIPPGTYTTAGAASGIFEFCSITTEPTSDTKFPQIKSANAGERIIITLTKADGVVTIQGCEPLTLRK